MESERHAMITRNVWTILVGSYGYNWDCFGPLPGNSSWLERVLLSLHRVLGTTSMSCAGRVRYYSWRRDLPTWTFGQALDVVPR